MKEKQKEIIECYVTAYNNFDVDGMLVSLSENIEFINISNGEIGLEIKGLEKFKEQAISAKQYFTERKQTIETWEFNQSNVTIGIKYKATLAIDLPNGLKKGETLELKGSSEFIFDNKKIISITDNS